MKNKYTRIDTSEEVISEWKKKYPNLKHVRTSKPNKGIMLLDEGEFVAVLQYDTNSRYITALEVSKEYRNKGIATDLLDYANTMGINKLSVRKTNSEALSLYRKYGYRSIKEDDTMVYMELKKGNLKEDITFDNIFNSLYEGRLNKIKKSINSTKKNVKSAGNDAKIVGGIIKVKARDLTPQNSSQALTKLRNLIYKRDFEAIGDGELDPISVSRQIIIVGGATVITPWLTLPVFFVDQLIESRINEAAVSRYITKVEKEKDNTSKEIKKLQEKDSENNATKIKHLKAHKDNLETAIMNLEKYREKVEREPVKKKREEKELKKSMTSGDGDMSLDMDDLTLEAFLSEAVTLEEVDKPALDIKSALDTTKASVIYKMSDIPKLRGLRTKLTQELGKLKREKSARVDGGVNLVKPVDKGVKRKAIDMEIKRVEKTIQKIDARIAKLQKDKGNSSVSTKKVQEGYEEEYTITDMANDIYENILLTSMTGSYIGVPDSETLDLAKLKGGLYPTITSLSTKRDKLVTINESDSEESKILATIIESLDEVIYEMVNLGYLCEQSPKSVETAIILDDIYESGEFEDIVEELDSEDRDIYYETRDLYLESKLDDATNKAGRGVRKVKSTIKKASRTIKKPVKKADRSVSNSVDKGFEDAVGKIKGELAGESQEEIIRGKTFKLSKMLKRGIAAGAGLAVAPVLTIIGLLTGVALKGKIKHREKEKILNTLKAELEIVEEKIKDADSNGDREAKYKLMRVRTKLKRDIDRLRYGIEDNKFDVKNRDVDESLSFYESLMYDEELIEGSLKSKIFKSKKDSGDVAKKIKDFLEDDTLTSNKSTAKDKAFYIMKSAIFMIATPGGIAIVSVFTLKKLINKFKTIEFDMSNPKDVKKLKSLYNSVDKAITKSKNKDVTIELEKFKVYLDSKYSKVLD